MKIAERMTQVEPHVSEEVKYEAARRQLRLALSEWAEELNRGDPQGRAASGLALRRSAVIENGLRFFGPMRRFVHHEVERWIDMDDPGISGAGTASAFPIDDIIAGIYLAAVDQADDAPNARAFYTWLRRIARREVRAAVLEQSAIGRTELSLDAPAIYVGEWPDHVVRLVSILADPTGVLPEDYIERREDRRVIDGILARLPERWREVFLMSVVDGWPDDEIAAAEGIDAWEVGVIVSATRAFLRDWLQDEAADHVA